MMAVGKNSIAGERLRSYVERIESINAQAKQLADDKRAIVAEAKASGFTPKAIAFVIKKRKMAPHERAEAEALEDLYMHAMGMASDAPLFRAAGLMSVDITSREAVVEIMKKFVPAGGAITVDAGGKPIRLTRDKDGNVTATEVVEPPAERERPDGAPAPRARPPVPEADGDGAELLGRDAFKANTPIIENPFPFGDPRRARWEKGWCEEGGTDGMDD